MSKRWPPLVINESKLTAITCYALLALMFISKISLKWTGLVPRSLPPLIFQHGLHPYLNFGLNIVGLIILFPLWVRAKNKAKFSRYYIIFLYLMLVILTTQTLFQIIFVNIGHSALMQLGGLGMSILLIFIYGIMIPGLLPVKDFARIIKNISVSLMLISLALLPVLWPSLFRGGRFIGIFKHIPHSVSASTFSFIFLAPYFFDRAKDGDNTWHKTISTGLLLILMAFTVFLTATKAAMVTIFIVFIVATMVYGSRKASIRMLKFVLATLATLGLLMFGVQMTEFLYEVATGQKSFLMRPAQDGIESRLEEIFRGIKIFEQNPWFGKGILYKFMGGNGVDINRYNSFKDPHNIFISAGVVGGWPFLILTVFGYLLLILGTIKCLLTKNRYVRMIGLFMISHLPVFIIYHVHLSLGGLGDRMYWLIFGYMAISATGTSTTSGKKPTNKYP